MTVPCRKLVRAPAVLWRRTIDGVLLLVPSSGELVQIDGAGAAIWAALADPADTDELNRHVAALFDTPPDRTRADVVHTIEELAKHGAVCECP